MQGQSSRHIQQATIPGACLIPITGAWSIATMISGSNCMTGSSHCSPEPGIATGKLALEIGDVRMKDRKDRVNYLKAHAGAGVKVFEAKLEDLLPKPGKRVREGIESANLVLITSQEIDAMGEEDNISLARRTMDE